jgi:hypothetical protein
MTIEQVEEGLEWLRAQGHYDRIIEEATAPAPPSS